MATFLLVDDEQVILNLLHILISNAYKDAEVRSVHSSEEAYLLLDTYSPDLIISDINRPGEDGYGFLNKLRENFKTRRIPVIAISGSSRDEHEELLQYRHGFNSVVPKPFNAETLFKAINKILEIHTDPNILLLLSFAESQSLDYKEDFNLSDKDSRAALAKDVIAMANWGGGTIIVGVAEPKPGQFSLKGISAERLPAYEVTKLNNSIRNFVDPHIHLSTKLLEYERKHYCLITVPPAKRKVYLAKTQNENAKLYCGRIYTRNTSAESAEIRTSAELRELLDRIQKETEITKIN